MKRLLTKKMSLLPSTKTVLIKTVFLLFGLCVLLPHTAYAGDLFGNASKLLSDIYAKFVSMSTAAAGVGVGIGVFMKKLSMGKQDRIELGNKVIKDCLIGWATLNALGLIITFVGNYVN